jgi:hypothetical protein
MDGTCRTNWDCCFLSRKKAEDIAEIDKEYLDSLIENQQEALECWRFNLKILNGIYLSRKEMEIYFHKIVSQLKFEMCNVREVYLGSFQIL